MRADEVAGLQGRRHRQRGQATGAIVEGVCGGTAGDDLQMPTHEVEGDQDEVRRVGGRTRVQRLGP